VISAGYSVYSSFSSLTLPHIHHYTILHHTTLHYTTLHYTTLPITIHYTIHRFDTNGSGKMIIQVDGREVALTCIHVGVDVLRVNEVLNNKVCIVCSME